ncbi:MAG: hypothetical protein LCH30_05990 [Proteobacteria bacterium]|nr:hypothetical protein [Pseudomonadota bacterium]
MSVVYEQKISEVDIEKYPTSFEPHEGSLTLGDLHGNPVKLLYSLIRHQMLQFKPGVDAEAAYNEFVSIYNEAGELTSVTIDGKVYDYQSLKNLNDRTQDTIKLHKTNIIKDITALKLNSSDYDLDNEEGIKKLEDKLKEIEPLPTETIKRIGYLREQRAIFNNRNETINALIKKLQEQFPILIKRFYAVLENLEVANRGLLRLIGDELADRGKNDLLTLIFMGFLGKQDIDLRINISNHSNQFIAHQEGLEDSSEVDPRQKPSLRNYQTLLTHQVIDPETMGEIERIVEEVYKPSLKAIDYQIVEGTPPSIRLFTHAPVRFALVEKLAEKADLPYKADTVEDLARTIDGINAFLTGAVKQGTVHELCKKPPKAPEQPGDPEGWIGHQLEGLEKEQQMLEDYPWYYVAWNRWDNEIEADKTARPSAIKGFFGVVRYNIEYVHGHDNGITNAKHVINTNNITGMMSKSEEKEEIDSAIRGIKTIIPDIDIDNMNYEDCINKIKLQGKNPADIITNLERFERHFKNLSMARYNVFTSDAQGVESPAPIDTANLSIWDKYTPLKALKSFFNDLFTAIGNLGSKKEQHLPEMREVHTTPNSDKMPETKPEATSSQTWTTSNLDNLKSGSGKMEEKAWTKAKPIPPHVSDSSETTTSTKDKMKAQLHHFKNNASEPSSEPLPPSSKP